MIINHRRQTDGAGYLFNDDRASGGTVTEADMISCPHCQRLIKHHDWKQDGGFCSRCFAPVCCQCADRMLTRGCEPFIKAIDRAVEAAYRRQQFRKIAGL